MTRDDTEFIYYTRYNVSLLAALGYQVKLLQKKKDWLKDTFMVASNSDVATIERKDFFKHAKKRHKHIKLL